MRGLRVALGLASVILCATSWMGAQSAAPSHFVSRVGSLMAPQDTALHAATLQAATSQAAAPEAAGSQAAPPAGAATQGGENPFALPALRKYWNPIVGAGAVYEVTGADGTKRSEEFGILSEETIDGKKAYWLEFAVQTPDVVQGKVYGKALVIPDGFVARKVIVQLPGVGAMEFPAGAPVPNPKADPDSKPVLVGTETITVAGGKFVCERWRNPDNSDVWLSSKVSPMKIVKIMGKDEKWVIVNTVSPVKDEIHGPVKAFDPEVIKKFAPAPTE